MTSLQKQIFALFEGLDPDLREVVTQVLLLEEELISYERPRYKDALDQVLDSVAKRTLKEELTDAN